jgi:hypothetical protein
MWAFHVLAIKPMAATIIQTFFEKEGTMSPEVWHEHLAKWTNWTSWTFQVTEDQTIYIWPWMAFGWLDLYAGFALALVASLVLPDQLGFMKMKVLREVDSIRKRIKLQANISTDAELNQWFSWSRNDIEAEAERRNLQTSVISEISDGADAERWLQRNMIGQLSFMPAVRLYMSHHFTGKYANNVQGAAYVGAALLIIVIGVRGLKFIPPEMPSPLLFSLFLEFSLLVLLGVTLIYTEEEERLDRILKELKERSVEQAQRLSTLNEQSTMQTQALVNVVRILSGVNTEDVSKTAHNRATELLSRAVAEGRVEHAVKEAADNALTEAYRHRLGQ